MAKVCIYCGDEVPKSLHNARCKPCNAEYSRQYRAGRVTMQTKYNNYKVRVKNINPENITQDISGMWLRIKLV
jgi:hypothetical protein